MATVAYTLSGICRIRYLY